MTRSCHFELFGYLQRSTLIIYSFLHEEGPKFKNLNRLTHPTKAGFNIMDTCQNGGVASTIHVCLWTEALISEDPLGPLNGKLIQS